MAATVRELAYDQAVAAMRAASTRDERRTVVRSVAETLGVSESTVYRQLKARGWSSGRQRRSDAGRSCVGKDGLAAVAEIQARGRNKRGQANVPTEVAVEIAQQQGLLPEVSTSTVRRLLRRKGLSLHQMRAPEPGISRVSQHPNHVWLVDVSVAIQWYFRDEGTGRKLDLYNDAGARFYSGKVENFRKLRRVLQRWCVVDHTSGAYYVRYYYESGEKASTAVDFLYRAMAAKTHAGDQLFRGVPRRLVFDLGPGFNNALVQNLLRGLGYKRSTEASADDPDGQRYFEYHAPGNAKASGAVEARHFRWQTTFEGNLALKPARDLEELNRQAELYCAVRCTERPLSRHNRPPMQAWLDIRDEQLVEAPDRDTFFRLAATRRQTGVLTSQNHLRAGGRTYYIAGGLACPRARVEWQETPLATDGAGIRVWDENGTELAATEVSFDAYGFVESGAPRHVWDSPEAAGSSVPTIPAAKVVAAAAAAEEPLQFDGLLDDLDQRLERQNYLARRGTPWTPPSESRLIDEPVISAEDALDQVVDELGRLSPEAGAWWREQLGDGVTPSRLQQLLAAAQGRESAQPKAELA